MIFLLTIEIKKIRKGLNLTQKEVAESMGVTQSYISKLEQDGYYRCVQPSLAFVDDLAHALGCCPLELLTVKCDMCANGLNKEEKKMCWKHTKDNLTLKIQKVD